MIVMLWLAIVAVAGWLAGLTDPSGYAVLLGAALVVGLVLSWQDTVMRLVCSFGAGIDLMLLAFWLDAREAEPEAVAGVGLAGAVVAVGSLVAAARGR